MQAVITRTIILLQGALLIGCASSGQRPVEVQAALSKLNQPTWERQAPTVAATRPSDNTVPLFSAVRRHELGEVMLLLQQGVDPQPRDSQGETPLMQAVESGQADVARQLVRGGANPFLRDHEGLTAIDRAFSTPATSPALKEWAQARIESGRPAFNQLRTAVVAEDAERLRSLLQQETFYRYTESEQGSPLGHQVAFSGCLGCVQALKSAGYDLNRTDSDGNTALYLAAFAGEPAMVGEFVRQGADRLKASASGWTPLMAAVQQGRTDVVTELLRGASPEMVNFQDAQGWTALHHAANQTAHWEYRQQLALVEQLLTAGADPNLTTDAGATPLVLAVSHSRAGLVRQLLAGGADPAIATREGVTPLMMAAYRVHLDMTRSLAAHRETLDLQDVNGWTALHYVIRNRVNRLDPVTLKVARHLIDQGANPNLMTDDGESTLEVASRAQHRRMIGLLVDEGASLEQLGATAAGAVPAGAQTAVTLSP